MFSFPSQLAQRQSEVWTWSERPKGDISAAPTGMGSWCPPIVPRLERSMGEHMLKWWVHGVNFKIILSEINTNEAPVTTLCIWVWGQFTGNLQVIPRYSKGMFVSKPSSGYPSSVNHFDSFCLWPTHIHVWANYNISLTWIKPIWGWFPLLTMISSEVAVRSL